MKTDESSPKLARCLTSLAVVVTILTTASAGRADCPAAPIADNDDLVISFLKANGTQAAPASVLPSSVKEGMLVYDDASDNLKICDGTNWIEVGAGGDTLAGLSCASGQIPKWNGAAWGCAASGGTPASPLSSVQFNDAGAFGGDAALSWDNTNKRLGIGTVTPSVPLETVGTIKAASGLLWSANGSTSTSRALLLENFDATATANGADIGVKLGGTEYQGLSWVKEAAWNAASAAASKDTMLQFGVLNDNTPAIPMVVRANGNVGIGTSNPAQKLHVEGGNVQISGSAAPGLLVTPTAGSSYVFGANTAISGAGIYDSTGGAWRLVVRDTTGNIGIGTTTPGEKLQIQSTTASTTIRVVGSLNGGGDINNRIDFADDRGLGYAGVRLQTFRNTVSGGQGLSFLTTANNAAEVAGTYTERMRINEGGNVGIGTTAPSYLLDVERNGNGLAGSTGILNLKFTAATNTQALQITQSNAGGDGAAASALFKITNAGSNPYVNFDGKFFMSQAGNVGIGTTSPVAPLTVGTSTSGGAIWLGATDSTAEGAEIIWSGAGSYPVWTQDVYTNYMRFFTNSVSNTQVSLANFGAGAMNFDIDGTAYKPGGGVWTASSDARLKDIDGAYEQALDSIVRLKTVRFHYKKGNPRHEPFDRAFVGLIAQDVQNVFPEAVRQRDDGYLDLDTTPINFALINAVKELKAANDDQSAAIEELRQEIKALKSAAHGGQ